MNIFCTGDLNNNLFKDFDFIKHNVAISGSIMSACLQRNHPLMNIFKLTDYTKFIKYFDEYYSEADIDVMFIAKDIPTFTENVRIFYNQICINMIEMYSQHHDTKLVLNKLGYLFVSEKFIQENISQDKNKIKWIKKNINTDEVLQLFKPFYYKLKEEKYKELINGLSESNIKELEDKFPDIYNTLDVEFKVYINNRAHKEIDLVYTYKYKITSKFLKHPLELFKINSDDFFSHVSQFHLPCVRGYYNGNVYLTPSCISALMTNMNIDYRPTHYDINSIIIKYHTRGFGTFMTTTKKRKLKTWLSNSKYKKLYK
jgi:hypothetical protein